MKNLSLIQAIIILDVQKPRKQKRYNNPDVQQFEVTSEDIGSANKLSYEIVGKILQNLSPQSGLLLLLIEEMADKACSVKRIKRDDFRFSHKDIREYTGWSNFRLKRHLDQLKQNRYIHKEGKTYELLYNGKKIKYFSC